MVKYHVLSYCLYITKNIKIINNNINLCFTGIQSMQKLIIDSEIFGLEKVEIILAVFGHMQIHQYMYMSLIHCFNKLLLNYEEKMVYSLSLEYFDIQICVIT